MARRIWTGSLSFGPVNVRVGSCLDCGRGWRHRHPKSGRKEPGSAHG